MTNNENGFTLTRKVFDPVEHHFTPGERSMVAWISTDCVDHERDVVVSAGIDYKTFFLGKTPEDGNPCVLAFHDFGRWPLGRCEWIKAKQSREFNGLYAKTVFDDDPETETVWRKIKSRSLRGISIGFRPPDNFQPGEWGPPTREELLRRPDWKGAERVIRRCVLLEYSVCSLPMNAQALVVAVNKGVHRPVFNLKVPEDPMETEPIEDAKTKCSCDGDNDDCEKCRQRIRAKAEDDDELEEDEALEEDELEEDEDEFDEDDELEEDEDEFNEDDELEEDEGELEEDEFDEDDELEEDEDDDAPEPKAIGPLRQYDHVRVKAPHYNGFGRIESFHTKGHVPHAAEDVIGSKEDPAACIKCYKVMGDGHAPTAHHVAAKLTHLTKLNQPFKTPAQGKRAAWETESTIEPLPPLVVQSDQEIRAEMVAKLNAMLSPDGLRKLVREEAERITGVV
ncbi:HK97 family phage prohead protease [Singulisphaera acidiphila]|uniref:DNA-directed RNA polymerase, delta subunit n=1 Tax=Singulisphaera acidiphila (strain ATCC BAA-1392 / DSM 18658 / VKM B-2454 / MOB10) TaxID=886293 RepID=L0DGA3_SINAD|nr:HK97 family phage prohead protease [Singulisphaera acidiphila]AGA28389.1 DNA-directed RNA polymerase, delta subunit [Singulisphaera acidiphila DSM 18658]